MFTLEEKQYLLKLLNKQSRFRLFGKEDNELRRRLTDKLEQMVRNELINKR